MIRIKKLGNQSVRVDGACFSWRPPSVVGGGGGCKNEKEKKVGHRRRDASVMASKPRPWAVPVASLSTGLKSFFSNFTEFLLPSFFFSLFLSNPNFITWDSTWLGSTEVF